MPSGWPVFNVWVKAGLQLHLWKMNSTSNSPVASGQLSCQISANKCKGETSVTVNKHWKTRAKGNEVLTNVISVNQHFASTFSMWTFKLQGRTCSCKLSFLFPPRHQSVPESLLAGYILIHDCIRVTQTEIIILQHQCWKLPRAFKTIQNPSSVTFPQFKCIEQFCSLI